VNPKILLAEDDPAIRTGVRDALASEGYRVDAHADGASALAALAKGGFDLAILDVSMPKKSGFDVCREARKRGLELPIVFLTVRADEVDKVHGLELGADDYVTKPFSLRELLARVAAILRRAKGGDARIPRRVAIGDREVDLEAFVIRRAGKESKLPPKEAGMLRLLLAHEGKVVTRERFLEEVWGSALFVGPRTVDTHMGRLRAKLEDDPERPAHLLTAHGVGYRLVR
jgi:two-component system, OmpR family, alkaline phosphatase synthesis response regulator PhoP